MCFLMPRLLASVLIGVAVDDTVVMNCCDKESALNVHGTQPAHVHLPNPRIDLRIGNS